MTTKHKRRKKPNHARGPYRRDLTGPTRYVRTRADVDEEVQRVYPGRTVSDAYRAALEAWVIFRKHLRDNPPTNAELDVHLTEVIL